MVFPLLLNPSIMKTIFHPILCVEGNAEIYVADSEDSNILFHHCYSLQKIMAPRIPAFKIITIEVNDLEEHVGLYDAIIHINRHLGQLLTVSYKEYLQSLDNDTLKHILDGLTLQFSDDGGATWDDAPTQETK